MWGLPRSGREMEAVAGSSQRPLPLIPVAWLLGHHALLMGSPHGGLRVPELLTGLLKAPRETCTDCCHVRLGEDLPRLRPALGHPLGLRMPSVLSATASRMDWDGALLRDRANRTCFEQLVHTVQGLTCPGMRRAGSTLGAREILTLWPRWRLGCSLSPGGFPRDARFSG